MQVTDGVIVAVSGFLAGAINTIAGGGSLVSFPALLAVGYSAKVANVTSTVGLLPGYLSGTFAYRRELEGQGRRAPSLVGVSLVGAGIGTVVLLKTPKGVFDLVVPWLVLAGAALMLAQPRVAALVRRRSGGELRRRPVPVHLGVLLGGVYGAYFGAALGVMLLALLGILLPDDLQRLNALKSLLSFAISVLSAAVYAAVAPVVWTAVFVLMGSSLVGGQAGGYVARRLPDRVLRLAVGLFGVVVGVALFFL